MNPTAVPSLPVFGVLWSIDVVLNHSLTPIMALLQSPPPDVIDMDTFQQILDLDEDGSREFSRGMAWAYFTQVDSTFDEMDEAL